MSTLTRNKLRKTLYIYLLLIFVSGCKSTPEHYSAPTIPTTTFRTADLALRLGRTIESDMIARGGDSLNRYSHIGIIIESDSGMIVVDIEPSPNKKAEKIKAQRIEKFFAPELALAGAVMRHNEPQNTEINTLTTKIIEYLNSSITFDHDYQLSDSKKMYCTELIERLFREINISLSEGRSRKLPLAKEPVILPSDITQNDNLATVWSYDLRLTERSAR